MPTIHVEILVCRGFLKAASFDVDGMESGAIRDIDLVGADAEEWAIDLMQAVDGPAFGALVGVIVEPC